MERYDEYKDSGVEWIGEIPAGWDVCRLKSVAQLRRGFGIKRDDVVDDGLPCVRYGELYTTYNGQIHDVASHVPFQAYETCEHLQQGDLVMAITGETKEDIGQTSVNLSGGEIAVGGDTLLIKDFTGDGTFLSYALSAPYAATQRLLDAQGEIIVHLSAEKVGNEVVVLPPRYEQTAIAVYLNDTMAVVDSLITDCEREVGLLQEYRKAVISEVVTKGLDPNAPMKDSGIEWIGKIPEVWDVARLKQLVRMQTGKTPSSSTPRYFDGSFPWFTPGDLQQFKVVESSRSVNISAISDGVLDFIPKGSTMIVCVGYSSGKASIAKVDCCTNQQITALSPIAINGGYLAYCSICFGQELLNLATFNRVPLMNNEFIGSVKVPVPSIPEQRAIVAYLDEKTTEIDALIAGYQSMADKLREYRKSLISEAVTGKFKVPGV